MPELTRAGEARELANHAPPFRSTASPVIPEVSTAASQRSARALQGGGLSEGPLGSASAPWNPGLSAPLPGPPRERRGSRTVAGVDGSSPGGVINPHSADSAESRSRSGGTGGQSPKYACFALKSAFLVPKILRKHNFQLNSLLRLSYIKADLGEGIMTATDKVPAGKRELLRQTILKAAAQLFAERGFAGTNLQDVADSLGISRPSLYYYFGAKDDILASLVEELTIYSQRLSSKIATQMDLDPADALRTLVRSHTERLLNNAVLFRVLDRSEADLPAKVKAKHEQAKHALLDDFTKVIERGIAIGCFRPMDAQVSAFAIIGMCNWTTWWFKPSGRKSLSEVAEILGELAVNSLKRHESRRPKNADVADVFRLIREDIDLLEIMQPKR